MAGTADLRINDRMVTNPAEARWLIHVLLIVPRHRGLCMKTDSVRIRRAAFIEP